MTDLYEVAHGVGATPLRVTCLDPIQLNGPDRLAQIQRRGQTARRTEPIQNRPLRCPGFRRRVPRYPASAQRSARG
jgi:hypothetical protein